MENIHYPVQNNIKKSNFAWNHYWNDILECKVKKSQVKEDTQSFFYYSPTTKVELSPPPPIEHSVYYYTSPHAHEARWYVAQYKIQNW